MAAVPDAFGVLSPGVIYGINLHASNSSEFAVRLYRNELTSKIVT